MCIQAMGRPGFGSFGAALNGEVLRWREESRTFENQRQRQRQAGRGTRCKLLLRPMQSSSYKELSLIPGGGDAAGVSCVAVFLCRHLVGRWAFGRRRTKAVDIYIYCTADMASRGIQWATIVDRPPRHCFIGS
jgi:hypothetical protein